LDLCIAVEREVGGYSRGKYHIEIYLTEYAVSLLSYHYCISICILLLCEAKPRHGVCKPAYMVPVPSQDKVGWLW